MNIRITHTSRLIRMYLCMAVGCLLPIIGLSAAADNGRALRDAARAGDLAEVRRLVGAGDMQRFCETMQVMLAGILCVLHERKESYYHSLFHVLAYLLNYDVHSEVMTSKGRIDLVITTSGKVYIFEFKFEETAKAALEQIDTKRYAHTFELLSLTTLQGSNPVISQRFYAGKCSVPRTKPHPARGVNVLRC